MFKKIKHIHFVGIGGIGMSGIAEVLLNLGCRVSGSDLKLSELTERLTRLGAKVYQGHDPSHISGANVVVYSSAVKLTNPEIQAAKGWKVPVIPRAEMLAELMRMKYGIGVAGTHGKTTTTSLIGLVLTEAGLDPTIVVGGVIKSLRTNAKLGQGDYIVVEADEFDRSFLRLTPTMAVVTTLEADHLDYYKDLKEIKAAFVEFVSKVPFYGSVVVCADEESVRSIIPEIERPMVTYGLSPGADLMATGLSFSGFFTDFTVSSKEGGLGKVELKVPGVYNVKNALAAAAVGLELGIPFETIKKALEKFSGIHRRFELKGERRGIMVIDDYAHHPTEIEAALKGAREGWDDRRLVAIFQPHLYSRTRDFYYQFGRSFLQADCLVVTDVYPAREALIEGVTGELVAEAAKQFGHEDVTYIADKDRIADFLIGNLKPGDVVITFGAGDVWQVGEELLAKI